MRSRLTQYMPPQKALAAQKIIGFYAEKGIGCTVAAEELSLLVTLSAGGRTHKFRYPVREPSDARHCKALNRALEKELSKLMPAAAPAAKKKPPRIKAGQPQPRTVIIPFPVIREKR